MLILTQDVAVDVVCLHCCLQQEKEHKKQDVVSRKAEARALLEAEEEAIGGKKVQRVTRVQIEEQQAKERERLQQEARKRQMEAKKLSEQDVLEENPNQLLRQAAMEGEVEARSVAEAISVLNVGQPQEAEKRLTYAEFEARELPLAKASNPHLKQSQVKQLVWKQWQRSPENPINAPMKVKR